MQLRAPEIYRYAREAGFSPDQAVTMTAIALAESGGRTDAHNASGEDSRGLWQINLDYHANQPWAQGLDMSNPAHNALAAFHVSKGGTDIRPWTVTHTDKGAPYTSHAADARAAAAGAGEGWAQGNFDGPRGYRDEAVPAGAVGGEEAGMPDGGPKPVVDQFIEAALRQVGDEYVFGHEVDLGDADPETFDCSELVQWAADQVGVDGVPDGSHAQYSALKAKGLEIPVEQALDTPGALLFFFEGGRGHVAISLGDGRTVEARGSAYGVVEYEAKNRFEHATLLPGVDHRASTRSWSTEAPVAQVLSAEDVAAANRGGVDTDADLLPDHYEVRYKLDPAQPDTDGDGITDGYELVKLGTDPLLSDSDFDGLADDVELALGLDPTVFDNPDPAASLTIPEDMRVDSDGDGLTDAAEVLARTDRFDPDTDDDGLLDGQEVWRRSDPLENDGAGAGGLDDGFGGGGFGSGGVAGGGFDTAADVAARGGGAAFDDDL